MPATELSLRPSPTKPPTGCSWSTHAEIKVNSLSQESRALLDLVKAVLSHQKYGGTVIPRDYA